MSNRSLNIAMAGSVLTAALGTAYLSHSKREAADESVRKTTAHETKRKIEFVLKGKKSADDQMTQGANASSIKNVLTDASMNEGSVFNPNDTRAQKVGAPFITSVDFGLYRGEALTTPEWNNITLGEIQNPPGAVGTIFDSIGTEDGNRVYDTSIARAYTLSKDSLDPVIADSFRDTLVDEAYLRLDREGRMPQQCDTNNVVALPFKDRQEALWMFAAAGLKPETQLMHVSTVEDELVMSGCEAYCDGFACGLENGYDSKVDMLTHTRDLLAKAAKTGRASAVDTAILMWNQRGE